MDVNDVGVFKAGDRLCLAFKRAADSLRAAMARFMTLMATWRSRTVSVPRNTVAMAPDPKPVQPVATQFMPSIAGSSTSRDRSSES